MPALDNVGKIAAAQIAFYTPVAAITLFLIFRYAFRRDAGWFWLFIFSAGNSTAFYAILFCFIEMGLSSTNCQWGSHHCRRIAVADQPATSRIYLGVCWTSPSVTVIIRFPWYGVSVISVNFKFLAYNQSS